MEMIRMFKVLPGFEKYAICGDGRVFSFSKHCYMQPSLTVDGYLQTGFVTPTAPDGYKVSIKIHRLVAKAFVPNPLNLPEVNHKDGDKTNNRYDNLEWCTRSENIRHCHALGLRSSRGERNGNYKTGKYVRS